MAGKVGRIFYYTRRFVRRANRSEIKVKKINIRIHIQNFRPTVEFSALSKMTLFEYSDSEIVRYS